MEFGRGKVMDKKGFIKNRTREVYEQAGRQEGDTLRTWWAAVLYSKEK